MIQQAQLIMTIEEISHRPYDTLVTTRTINPVYCRDSVLYLSALGEQVTGLKIGQRLRVTVEVIDGESSK
jgi:hypothetical protein